MGVPSALVRLARVIGVLVTLHGAVAMAGSGPCSALEQYLSSRQATERAGMQPSAVQLQAWLDSLLSVMDDPDCGSTTARKHAFALASELNDYSLSEIIALGGVEASREASLRASWRFDMSQASFRLRTSREDGVRRAIRSLDEFIQVAPDLDAASVDPRVSASILPTLAAMTQKAKCYRELGDLLSSAAIEQQVAGLWASTAGDKPRSGGFLPEEALFRAALDYAHSDQVVAAASAISAIRALPLIMRPATQHAANLVSSITDCKRAVLTSDAILRTIKPDGWSLIQVALVVPRREVMELSPAELTSAIWQIDVVLSLPEEEIASIRTKLNAIGTPEDAAERSAHDIAAITRARSELTAELAKRQGNP